MRCADCQLESPGGARFCMHCAAPLPAACAECGTEVPTGARFCPQCAHPVAAPTSPQEGEAAVTQPGSPISPFRPAKHLADKILKNKSALEGERKQVTVLFADVKGSMELAEQLDPEEWSAIMQRFFKILSDGVERFEGFVDKFTGDGIMALFGAPIAHEDHAQRACYAALHLRDALRTYADELRRTVGLSFSVRIGLNSGDVVVGTISGVGKPGESGADLRMDYTAQGHTVGLAQRMEQLAAADSAYLTEYTANLVAGYFDVRDLGAFELKGASAPLNVYELRGVGAMRSRLDRSRARGFSRLVGRADELAVLENALNRSVEGRGGVIGVVPDAGVGKSRLCSEFVERARARGIAVYEAHCPSHGKVVPLLPILEMFRGFFGIAQNDSDQFAREKIAGRMLLLDRDLEPFLPLAFEFLGVPDPENSAPDLEPPVRQRQLLTFTRRLVQAWSVREPAVLFFDDAHWVDDSSDAFISQVADIVPGTRTMLLLNFRPEYSAEWMARPSYQQLPLHPLGDEAIDALLADLLGNDPSLAQLPPLMRERTGGNPFFIEEIVHSMVDSGSLVGERGAYRLDAPIDRLEIPPTVHGILAARIDRLSEREKSVLQTAAAIGLRFSEPLLRRVSALSAEDVDAALAALHAAEFLYEEALYPEVEYSFRHPLTQEVAERSQLATQRRQIHVAVARALEELHADKPDENAALLAHHWDLGGEAKPAALWHRRAAEWIAGNNSPEAKRHWARVRELADEIAEPALALDLGRQSRLMLLEYGWRLGLSADETNELFAEGEEWARRHDDQHALAALYNAFSIGCAFSLGEARRARDLCTEGLRLAEEVGDGALACALELRLFFIANAMGVVPETMDTMAAAARRSDDEKERASPLVGYDVPATIAGWRGLPQLYAGEFDTALGHFRRGIALARAREAVEAMGWLLQNESALWYARGDAARAGTTARECLEIAERIESPVSQAMGLHSLGCALVLEGDLNAALATLERAHSLTERVLKYVSAEVLSEIVLVHCSMGQLAEAEAVAEQALALATRRGALRGEIYALRALSEVHVAHGGDVAIAEARRLLDAAESRAGKIGNQLVLPGIYEIRARAAGRAGDAPGFETALSRAQQLYRDMGAPLQVERLAKEFSR